MSVRTKVLQLQSMYAANGQVHKRNLVKWMSRGASPVQIMHVSGLTTSELCAYIRSIAADLRYLELLS